MGITCTDVSKGAADMVLSDDNFATIIAAVEEGRKVYSNIKKAVQFLLSANIAEVVSLFAVSVILNMPFLTPVMILWVNLVTDSLPALSLGVEKAEKDIMMQPPRKAGKSLFAGRTGRDIFIQGTIQSLLVLGTYLIGVYALGFDEASGEIAVSVTMAFVTLAMMQLFHAYNLRSQHCSLFVCNPLNNKYLNGSFLVGTALVAAVVLIPFMNSAFNSAWLSLTQWLIAVGMAFMIIPIVELQKFIERKQLD
jgi:Ca2+-transporting ATPase